MPSLQKQLKEDAIVPRQSKKFRESRRIKEENLELLNLEENYDVFEIEVEIADKFIYGIIVDDGSNVNIMPLSTPLSTMQKLGLQITHPSIFNLKMANQGSYKPRKL